MARWKEVQEGSWLVRGSGKVWQGPHFISLGTSRPGKFPSEAFSLGDRQWKWDVGDFKYE